MKTKYIPVFFILVIFLVMYAELNLLVVSLSRVKIFPVLA